MESGRADEGSTQDTSIQAAASTAASSRPQQQPPSSCAVPSKGFSAGIKGLANGAAAAVPSNVGAVVTSSKVGAVNSKPASAKKNVAAPAENHEEEEEEEEVQRVVAPITPKFKVFNEKVNFVKDIT